MWMRPKGRRAISQGASPGAKTRVPERVVLVGVAVGPAVHRDGEDVARGIEAAASESAAELSSRLALEGLEARREQLVASCGVLLARAPPGAAGGAGQVEHHRLLGGPREAIGAEAHGEVEAHARVVAGGKRHRAHAELLESPPGPDEDVRVDERHLRAVEKRLLLRFVESRDRGRESRVPAAEHDVCAAHSLRLAAAHVGDLDLFRALRASQVAHPDAGAAETDAHLRRRAYRASRSSSRGDDVLHRAARGATRDEAPDEEPRDRSVAVGEVEDVGLRPGAASPSPRAPARPRGSSPSPGNRDSRAPSSRARARRRSPWRRDRESAS